MNKQKFVEFIRQPDGLSTKNLEEIQDVLKTYPYFQNARIILAKGSKIKELADSKEKIASAAIYATNRLLLKKYINDELIFLRSLQVHESVQTDLRTASKSAKETPTTISPAPEPKKVETIETPPVEEEEEVIAEVKTETPAPEPSKEVIQVQDKASPASETEEHSDLDDLISDLWKDVEALRKSKARFLEIEKKLEEDEAVDQAVKKATQKVGPVKKPTSKAASTKATQKSTAAKKSVKKASSTTKKPATKSSTKSTSKKSSDGSSEKSSKGDKSDKSDPRSLQNSLIENFINTNPTMPPANRSGNSSKTEDLSKDSSEFRSEIASEYLAEIFMEQGKKDRAVEIYKTLSLKFPEKKSYFAALIKNLK